MMVGDRIGKEILIMIQLHLDLGAAQIGITAVFNDLPLPCETMGKIIGDLENGEILFGNGARDRHTDPGFVMSRQRHLIGHVGRKRTMGKNQLILLRKMGVPMTVLVRGEDEILLEDNAEIIACANLGEFEEALKDQLIA